MAKKKKDEGGWIKLYRKITNTDIWKTSEPFDRRSAWVDLLLMANHEDRSFVLRNGKTIYLEPGQTFKSMDTLAERWRWSRGRVIRYLRLLSEQGMCTLSSTTDGTTITIVNWGFFQTGRTTNGTTVDTTNGTTGGTTDGTRTRTNIQELNTRMKNKKAAAPQFDSQGVELEE